MTTILIFIAILAIILLVFYWFFNKPSSVTPNTKSDINTDIKSDNNSNSDKTNPSPAAFLMNDGSGEGIVLDGRVESNIYAAIDVTTITERNAYIDNYRGDNPMKLKVEEEGYFDNYYAENEKMLIKVTNIWDRENYNIEIVDYDSNIANMPVHTPEEGASQDPENIYYFLVNQNLYNGDNPADIPDGFKKARGLAISQYGLTLGKETNDNNKDDFHLIINGVKDGVFNDDDGVGGRPPGVGAKLPPKTRPTN